MVVVDKSIIIEVTNKFRHLSSESEMKWNDFFLQLKDKLVRI